MSKWAQMVARGLIILSDCARAFCSFAKSSVSYICAEKRTFPPEVFEMCARPYKSGTHFSKLCLPNEVEPRDSHTLVMWVSGSVDALLVLHEDHCIQLPRSHHRSCKVPYEECYRITKTDQGSNSLTEVLNNEHFCTLPTQHAHNHHL